MWRLSSDNLMLGTTFLFQNEGFVRKCWLPDGDSRCVAYTGIACERCGHLNVLKPFFVVCAFGRPSPSTMAGVHTGQVMRVVQGLGPGVVQQDDHSDRPGGEEQQADPSGGGGTSSMPPSFIDAPPPRGGQWQGCEVWWRRVRRMPRAEAPRPRQVHAAAGPLAPLRAERGETRKL